MKIIITVMIIVIILMIMVMKFAKNQTNTMAFQSKYTPLRHYYYLVKEGPINLGRSRPPPQTCNAYLI